MRTGSHDIRDQERLDERSSSGDVQPKPQKERAWLRQKPYVLTTAGLIVLYPLIVSKNLDASGYLKNTAWLDNSDGFFYLDRNYNGQVDGGSELFSNSVVALSERGLQGMCWVDANYDGKLTAADPVWDELKVWRDADGFYAANEEIWEIAA